jgi:hypothetical protein
MSTTHPPAAVGTPEYERHHRAFLFCRSAIEMQRLERAMADGNEPDREALAAAGMSVLANVLPHAEFVASFAELGIEEVPDDQGIVSMAWMYIEGRPRLCTVCCKSIGETPPAN